MFTRSQAQSKSPAQLEKTHVNHVQQCFDWDCGLACVAMVLCSVGVTRASLPILHAMASSRSIWTIDLAVLLRHFGVDVSLFTTTLGVDPSYAHEAFYADALPEDGLRVERLFRDARGLGIRVEQRSLSADELRRCVLSGEFLVVALVDNRVLRGSTSSRAGDALRGYGGHYVLLCGYNAERRAFVLLDPALAIGLHFVSETTLDEARKAFGTDEDLILVKS